MMRIWRGCWAVNKHVSPTNPPPIPRDRVQAIFSLSPLQRGMLFHDLASAGPSPYFRQVSFRLEGSVDAAMCRAAWNALMVRHPLLRSAFDVARASQPLQIVLKTRDVEFVTGDLSAQPGRDRWLDQWKDADRQRGFDLLADPLMRVALFRLDDQHSEMVWSHPHILLDGWSGAILLGEFAHIYAGLRAGRFAQLPPAPDPGVYVQAVRDRDQSPDFWLDALAGYDGLASLPRDGGGPSRPAVHSFVLDDGVMRDLTALAQSRGVTAGVMVQALWGLVLAGWTGRDDVVFGQVVSGRSVAVPQVDALVGMLINTIPVRVRFNPRTDRFGDLLARLHAQSLAALDHDHVGLAELQDRLGLPHGLLDHVLVLENYPDPAADGELETGFRVLSTHSQEQANYDFGVMIQPGTAGLTVSFPHDGGRFSPAMMQALENHFRTTVAWVLAHGDAPLAGLVLPQGGERDQLTRFGHGPTRPHAPGLTMAGLWHDQARRTPGNLALVDGDDFFTYAQLDRRAEKVAQDLRALGVGQGHVVGVLAGRGWRRIAALLGILKVGAACQPLSPAFPDDRLAFVLRDTGCRLVLADSGHLFRLSAPSCRLIAEDEAHGQRQPAGDDGQSLAYVIHTSGSTGQPKGVGVIQSGFINMILAQIKDWGLTGDDRVVQFASCSFDASLSEIFMALLSGAALVLASEDDVRDGARFLGLINRHQVTVATLPPSYLRALDHADLSRLRLLVTAGEGPHRADADHYARYLRYINAYGPTETSVCASWHHWRPGDDGPIPIGAPIANTAMSVRDAWGRLLPLGAVGEIWLAGAGLAQGYLGRPDLTADRFVMADGQRHYRTGDLGRWRADGAMLYLGRRDGQIKLNGYRIEIGEIEDGLLALDGVAQAAVAVRGDPARLLGWVVADDGQSLTPGQLRAQLARTLPPWMVPGRLMVVASLPRTAAGKIDRAALPEPSAADDGGLADPPADMAEQAVADAFQQVLAGGPFGRQASFSALGGDSLRAIRLLSSLRRAGLTVDLASLLRADTVAAIAALTASPPPEDAANAEDAGDAVDALPLSPIQSWFLNGHGRGHAHLNHHILLESDDRLDPQKVQTAVAALWRHHDALRLTFACGADGQWRQRVGDCGQAPTVPVIDLRDQADPWPILAQGVDDRHGRLDLATGPLFQPVLYRLPQGDALSLLAHHLVTDAVSWRFLLEDLAMALDGQSLPPVTTSYAAWVRGLGRWLASDGLAAQRPHWLDVALAPVPSLPGQDHPHSYADTRTQRVDLGAMPTGMGDVAVLARLLAALSVALHGWDGRSMARIMLTSHGRNPPVPGLDPSRTVGWFSAEFPILLPCGPQADAAAIRDLLLSQPDHGLGWGVLRWLGGDSALAVPSQVTLTYLGDITPGLEDGMRVSSHLPLSSIGSMERTRLLELEAGSEHGRLWVSVRHCPVRHPDGEIRALLDQLCRSMGTFSDQI